MLPAAKIANINPQLIHQYPSQLYYVTFNDSAHVPYYFHMTENLLYMYSKLVGGGYTDLTVNL